MDARATPSDPTNDPGTDPAVTHTVLTRLADAAEGVIRQEPGAVEAVLALAGDSSLPPDHRRAAEAVGMMIVKLEAREYDLELRNERLEAAARLRDQASLMLTVCILLISGYTLTFATLRGLLRINGSDLVSTLYNLGVLAVMLGGCAALARLSRLPMAAFGLTLVGAKRSVREALVMTVLISLMMTGVKAALPASVTSAQPFFNWASLSGTHGAVMLAVYALSSLLQEGLARGVMQGMLERLLVGRFSAPLSVLLASTIFATMHVHLSPLIGLAAFTQGLVFGWFYRRHRCLIGVTLAHFLFGAYTLSVLGYDWMLY